MMKASVQATGTRHVRVENEGCTGLPRETLNRSDACEVHCARRRTASRVLFSFFLTLGTLSQRVLSHFQFELSARVTEPFSECTLCAAVRNRMV